MRNKDSNIDCIVLSQYPSVFDDHPSKNVLFFVVKVIDSLGLAFLVDLVLVHDCLAVEECAWILSFQIEVACIKR